MKLLLTSCGVTNATIRAALVEMLGKPVDQCDALCIPTAQWGHPMCGPRSARGFVAGGAGWETMTGLGWASIGLLELTALPTIGAERWTPWVREADVVLVDGGDATYLFYWMRESGLAELLPSLADTVWVGVSAGSMVMTPRIGAEFVAWPQAPVDRTGLPSQPVIRVIRHEPARVEPASTNLRSDPYRSRPKRRRAPIPVRRDRSQSSFGGVWCWF